jgi:hypothetical protein
MLCLDTEEETMKKTSLLATGSLAAAAFGFGTGCGPSDPAPQKPSGSSPAPAPAANDPVQQVDASIQQSLDRLSALQIFSVGGLVLNLPAAATACYSIPCSGDTQGWAEYHAERARQAPRLAALAAQAEDCNSGHCYVSIPTSVDEAVSALDALQIVEVGGLIQAQPKNNPDCYNLPCPSDQAAAEAENNRRAAEAFTIATYAKIRGL